MDHTALNRIWSFVIGWLSADLFLFFSKILKRTRSNATLHAINYLLMTERLIKFLGKDLKNGERIHFYDFIENYISDNVRDWEKAPDTDLLAASFAKEMESLPQPEFSFLLLTTGYLPEFYKHDSSQETLYSKLVEVLVCEWAKRIGFTDSSIQKQKSSKEDVTISLGNIVIVCDAKTFRLGRSQAAPNVKDTIKKADYDKWKEYYRAKEYKEKILFSPIGGLITFPLLHKWKKGSDVILYCTDKSDPILILLYEYMAFMLVGGISHESIIDVLTHYSDLFPAKTKDQHKYFTTVVNRMFGERNEGFEDFMKLCLEIVTELVTHKIELINNHISQSTQKIKEEISGISNIEELRKRLIKAETKLMSNQLSKQLVNIEKFRVAKSKRIKKKEDGLDLFDEEENDDQD